MNHLHFYRSLDSFFPEAYNVLILVCTGASGKMLNKYINGADTNPFAFQFPKEAIL